MRRILMSMVIAGFLAGCASTDTKDEGAPVIDRQPQAATQPQAAPPQKPAAPTVQGVESKPLTANPLKDPGSILSKRSIYFDYDSSSVKEEDKPLVTAHARFLTDNRNRKITIQGNTDERGSREYNIGLGQRRADSVKKMMMLLGVTDAQIETVSFGEEKPAVQGADESAWAKNRRADIVYDGE
jgi:peptidoglycan-associated lipoprotein